MKLNDFDGTYFEQFLPVQPPQLVLRSYAPGRSYHMAVSDCDSDGVMDGETNKWILDFETLNIVLPGSYRRDLSL